MLPDGRKLHNTFKDKFQCTFKYDWLLNILEYKRNAQEQYQKIYKHIITNATYQLTSSRCSTKAILRKAYLLTINIGEISGGKNNNLKPYKEKPVS